MRFQAIILILVLGASIWLAKVWQGKTEAEPTLISKEALAEKKLSAAAKNDFPLSANISQAQVFSQSPISTSTGANACNEIIDAQAVKAEFIQVGRSRFELNIRKKWPTASLIKLLTAAVISENMDLSKQVVLTNEAVSSEGTVGNFKVGEIFTAQDLLKAAILLSSNDAIMALAANFEPGNLIELMKAKAAEIGLSQTQIFEPTGLSWRNQSTAEDMAILASYIYFNHPEIFSLSREKSAEITELKSVQKKIIYNINKFAGKENFIGGKTGYIDEAKGNLASVFEINGQPAAIIVLGANDRFAETEKIIKCISRTAF